MLVARMVGCDAGIRRLSGRRAGWGAAPRRTARAARAPLAIAPWIDGVSRWSPHTKSAVAQVDRPAQLAAAGRRRAARRAPSRDVRWSRSAGATPCASAISARTSSSPVGASVELATSARPSGL